MREAELKHGRLAMVAALLLPLSEQFTDKLGIHFFQENPEFIGSFVDGSQRVQFYGKIRSSSLFEGSLPAG